MQFQKRYILGSFLAVALALTVIVACFGHERRADAGPQTTKVEPY